MTTFTTIPNSSLEPGKPIRSIDGLALRDNPIAITEGAAGAPRIAAAALQTGSNERDWVLARTAAADVGAVGTYAFLGETASVSTPIGGTRAGSALRYVSVQSFSSSWGAVNQAVFRALSYGTSPSGTWRAMGQSTMSTDIDGIYSTYPATLWLRIS